MNAKHLKSIFRVTRILCFCIGVFPFTFPVFVSGQSTPEDGLWSDKNTVMLNTPEAALMARTGDIDNLGFGWPVGFNPFSGNNTPTHYFPWSVDPNDPAGTDCIMVLSSYAGSPPYGQDGYTGTTSRPANLPQAIVVSYNVPEFKEMEVSSAAMQLFVDDFQAPVWGANFQVTLNGVRASFLENVINSLAQTGPIGKLITVQIPGEFLDIIRSGEVSIFVDDPVTGAGDGYAIDFIKILVNPTDFSQTSTVTGFILDQRNQVPLPGAVVSIGPATSAPTGEDGFFKLTNVPAGLAILTVTCPGYKESTYSVQTVAQQQLEVNFPIPLGSPTLVIQFFPESLVLSLKGAPTAQYTLWASDDLTEWKILGDLEQVEAGYFQYVFPPTLPPVQPVTQFYRVSAQ
jgi:hypothetical protein